MKKYKIVISYRDGDNRQSWREYNALTFYSIRNKKDGIYIEYDDGDNWSSDYIPSIDNIKVVVL